MKENNRCSILFHLLVPGGKWHANFERIARLRLKLSDSDFRKWLRMPNAQLDGESPLEVIRKGEVQVISEFVEDMLLGNPT
jgi:hypothetical protein